MKIVMGPLLGFRGQTAAEDQRYYWKVCILVVVEDDNKPLLLNYAIQDVATTKSDAIILKEHGKYRVWRFDLSLEQTDSEQRVDYNINGGVSYSFLIPAKGLTPRLAYASCSGFSSLQAMKKVKDQYAMWDQLTRKHAEVGFHLLLMGGDQLYADVIWEVVPEIKEWAEKRFAERLEAKFTKEMEVNVENFYFATYCQRWSQPPIARALAQIPTLMMWDDHDIFDGWGSYPIEQQNCHVYKGIFKHASEHFSLFQLQADSEHMPTSVLPDQDCFTYAYKVGNLAIVALDMRSERTLERVMSEKTWQAFLKWAHAIDGCKHLILMSSIPVVYPNFNMFESVLGWLPGQQELEDDLKDHWLSRSHQTERLRLIHRLFELCKTKSCRVTILSGDVHVAALGIIQSHREGAANCNAHVINQLISSGIVHTPPPGALLYFMEKVIGGTVEDIDRGITAQMIKFPGSSNRFIGARNWLSLVTDEQSRIWAEWHVEGEAETFSKVIHPVN